MATRAAVDELVEFGQRGPVVRFGRMCLQSLVTSVDVRRRGRTAVRKGRLEAEEPRLHRPPAPDAIRYLSGDRCEEAIHISASR